MMNMSKKEAETFRKDVLYKAQHISYPMLYNNWRKQKFQDKITIQMTLVFDIFKAFTYTKTPTNEEVKRWTELHEAENYFWIECPDPLKYGMEAPLCYSIYMLKNEYGYFTKEYDKFAKDKTVWCSWNKNIHTTYGINLFSEYKAETDEEAMNLLLDKKNRKNMIAVSSKPR